MTGSALDACALSSGPLLKFGSASTLLAAGALLLAPFSFSSSLSVSCPPPSSPALSTPPESPPASFELLRPGLPPAPARPVFFPPFFPDPTWVSCWWPKLVPSCRRSREASCSLAPSIILLTLLTFLFECLAMALLVFPACLLATHFSPTSSLFWLSDPFGFPALPGALIASPFLFATMILPATSQSIASVSHCLKSSEALSQVLHALQSRNHFALIGPQSGSRTSLGRLMAPSTSIKTAAYEPGSGESRSFAGKISTQNLSLVMENSVLGIISVASISWSTIASFSQMIPLCSKLRTKGMPSTPEEQD
mmetsp:Transcript_6516/g.12900  ORF Transcript_6516/g.12900 Transcript_6516/m.12900 type:complete len:309 (-) Transcript_6516:500-1426(-)